MTSRVGDDLHRATFDVEGPAQKLEHENILVQEVARVPVLARHHHKDVEHLAQRGVLGCRHSVVSDVCTGILLPRDIWKHLGRGQSRSITAISESVSILVALASQCQVLFEAASTVGQPSVHRRCLPGMGCVTTLTCVCRRHCWQGL